MFSNTTGTWLLPTKILPFTLPLTRCGEPGQKQNKVKMAFPYCPKRERCLLAREIKRGDIAVGNENACTRDCVPKALDILMLLTLLHVAGNEQNARDPPVHQEPQGSQHLSFLPLD